jgi:hypothetical protein
MAGNSNGVINCSISRQMKMKLLTEDSFIKLTDLCKLGKRLCKMKFIMQKIIDPNYRPPEDASYCAGL